MEASPKRILILGSTGTIGCAALDVCAALRDEFEVVGLAAGARWERLAEQARQFKPQAVAIHDERHFDALRQSVSRETRVFAGEAGLIELIDATEPEFVLAGIVGAAGLRPVVHTVKKGIDVGLANKEALVIAGSILMPLARESGCTVVPVDSEHSAVFQALHSGQPREVCKIYLTASGGPFRTWPREKIERATLADALRHPTWAMGPKITIDSATMMNKALEVIEATHLFGFDADGIEVLVHPESIVHSMVEFCDGSVIAQLGAPDMRTPIQYAMCYPRRRAATAATLRWDEARSLTFEPPDFERFPALRLGFDAARAGGSAGAVLNAANEVAVERFRAGALAFSQVSRVTEAVYRRHRPLAGPTLDELLACDAWARSEVDACMKA